MNRAEIRISGLGGQGVIMAGQVLGRAAVYSGKNAVQTQSYGAEARGSAAKSEVVISDGRIGFPGVSKCDILVIMNQTALDENFEDLRDYGFLLVDSSHIENLPKTKAKVFKIPATEIAKREFSAAIYANMIMLGALIKITKLTKKDAMEKAVMESVPGKTVKENLNALKKGFSLKLHQLKD